MLERCYFRRGLAWLSGIGRTGKRQEHILEGLVTLLDRRENENWLG